MSGDHDTEENPAVDADTGGIVVTESDEATPAVVETCGECGGGPDRQPLVRLAPSIPPPAGPSEAWALRDHSAERPTLVCISAGDSWSWCHRTGWFTGRMRVRWDRRSKPRTGNDLTPDPVTWKRKPEI